MKPICSIGIAIIGLIWLPLAVMAAPPQLIKSIPANGAADVPVDIGKITLFFDQNMKMNAWSVMMTQSAAFPPMIASDSPWIDPLTYELKVKTLKPHTTYAIQLNSPQRAGFMAAEDQKPLPITVIQFTTAAQAVSQSGGANDLVVSEKLPDRSTQTSPGPTRYRLRVGDAFEVTRSYGIEGVESGANGQQAPFRFFNQFMFTETIEQTDGRSISQASRKVTTARISQLDPASGQMASQDIVSAGTAFRVQHHAQETVLVDPASGQQIWQPDLLDAFGPPLIPRLWPDGKLTRGQRWSYQDADLAQRIMLIGALGGRIDLHVESIAPEPSTGLELAKIRGNLNTRIDLGEIILNFQARVEIDLPIALGVPVMVKFDGKLDGQGVGVDQWGQPANFQMAGDGAVLQICKPAASILRAPGAAAGGSLPADPVSHGRGGGDSSEQGAYPPSLKQSAQTDARQGQGVYLTLYREQHQGAFYMLIPKGWQAKGGMIPSGVGWNVVDLVENNIQFRVTSPDGKSFFGWYPRFYFQDPAQIAQASWGNLRKAPGEALNGCWLYPYMGIEQYVQTIVFGQFAAQEFVNPRLLGPAKPSPELQPWAPRQAGRSSYGHVNFECMVNGVPSIGRIYTIIYDISGLLWSTVGTFGWVAPKDRWQQDERIMELCIRSFRLDPRWARRASEAADYRAKGYNKVIQDMHRIDNEIQQHRCQTRSDIQEEFYKVITDQIETYDPQTNQVKYLPMYNHAYTDGHGNYFLKDHDDGTLPVDNASEWRKLQIVNRNDPNYRPLN